jgi:hypothetical protein
LFTLKLYLGNISKRKIKGKMSKDKKVTDKCTLCDAQLTFCGGTTNLINHVKLKHPAESPAESLVKQSSLKSFVDSPFCSCSEK